MTEGPDIAKIFRVKIHLYFFFFNKGYHRVMGKFWKRQKLFEIQLNERGQKLFLLNLCFASGRTELLHNFIFMLKFNKNSNLFQDLIFYYLLF